MSTENNQNNQGGKTNYENWMDKVAEGCKEREPDLSKPVKKQGYVNCRPGRYQGEIAVSRSSLRELRYLEQIAKTGRKDICLVKDDPDCGPHLVASAIVEVDNQEIGSKTAIYVRESDYEFSTFVGQVPRGELGAATVVALNQLFNGKFVTSYTARSGSVADLLYVTTAPIKWIMAKGIDPELERHALTLASAKAVLRNLNDIYPLLAQQSSYQVVEGMVTKVMLQSLNISQHDSDNITKILAGSDFS